MLEPFYLVWICIVVIAAIIAAWTAKTRQGRFIASGIFALCATPFPIFGPGEGGLVPASLVALGAAMSGDPEVIPFVLVSLLLIAAAWAVIFPLATVWILIQAQLSGQTRIWKPFSSFAQRAWVWTGLIHLSTAWSTLRHRYFGRDPWRCTDCLMFNAPRELECPCGRIREVELS